MVLASRLWLQRLCKHQRTQLSICASHFSCLAVVGGIMWKGCRKARACQAKCSHACTGPLSLPCQLADPMQRFSLPGALAGMHAVWTQVALRLQLTHEAHVTNVSNMFAPLVGLIDGLEPCPTCP